MLDEARPVLVTAEFNNMAFDVLMKKVIRKGQEIGERGIKEKEKGKKRRMRKIEKESKKERDWEKGKEI